ncbi:MAG: c-type cytochrome [Chitinophagaceae bacterium]|nr:c-type cytochrome [Chitinophagaceae bacterium]
MKKVTALLFVAAIIYSCGDGQQNESESKSADTAATAPAPAQDTGGGAVGADAEKALTLIGGNDCTTCHAIDRKIIGPAYTDVAKKYEDTPANVDTLISKIKHGGSGNWGQIAMTPHPNLSDDDARTMVKYILSLKNQ